jgi:hypothetical protein
MTKLFDKVEKDLIRKNTLAYFPEAFVMQKKCFIRWTHEPNVLKLYTSVNNDFL